MPRRRISLPAARRIALAAQGFDRARPETAVNAGHLKRTIRRLGLLQLDYVNVLVPAHLLVLYSRLGDYDTQRFHRLVYQGREFTEQWAHEASIVPVDLWPVLEHRRREYRPWPNSPIAKIKGRKRYLEAVLALARESGPVTAHDMPEAPHVRRRPGDWHRSMPRWALEHHFGTGQLAVANRLPNFQRVYDVPENQIDEQHLGVSLTREEAQRELLRRAAAAHGVGTLHDLADYFRMSPREAAPRLQELVEAGELQEVVVAGWRDPAFLAPSARCPRKIIAASLLSPFDPVVWYRPRAERLFGFHYRIEIYVPAERRKWGYYVLPFLLDDRIVARVDLKADRRKRALLVLAAHAETGIDEPRTAEKLAAELASLADWLQLEEVRVGRRGNFSRSLSSGVRALRTR
jgi:uncharacterized protein YcaQ